MYSTTRRILFVRRTGAAAAAVLAVALAAGCGSATEPTTTSNPASLVSNKLNPATLAQVAETVAKGGLAVTGQKDATDSVCGRAECSAALTTDQFTLLQFPTTGRAEVYTGENLDTFQVLDVVATFPTGTSAADRTRYQEAIQRALT